VEDLAECPDGLRVTIRHSKTDQEGEGQEIAIPRGYCLCPVEAVLAWLAAAEITTGPIFRRVLKGGRISAAPLSPFSAAEIVKHYATCAGLDPRTFAGHSLRSGFLTSSGRARCVGVQDDGGLAPPLSRYAPRLCAAGRSVQGTRRRGVLVRFPAVTAAGQDNASRNSGRATDAEAETAPVASGCTPIVARETSGGGSAC
jgi:hypothetical protein